MKSDQIVVAVFPSGGCLVYSDWIQKGHVVFNQLDSLPPPVIAKVEGYALGGGLELAMTCDLIVASRDAKLGQPEANLGLITGWGGTFRLLTRVGGGKGQKLFFTGKIIEAETAYAIRLVDFVGSQSEIEAYLPSLREDVCKCGPVAVSQMLRLVNNSLSITVQQSYVEGAAASCRCTSLDRTRSRVAAFLESRQRKRG